MQFFRALLPSWKFFVQVEESPQLEFRLQTGDSTATWENALTMAPRQFKHIFVNSHGNDILAAHSLLERWEQENFSTDFTSYELVRNLAKFQISQTQKLSTETHFQFRIVRYDQMNECILLFLSNTEAYVP